MYRIILPTVAILYFAYCALTVKLYPYSENVTFRMFWGEFKLDMAMWQICYLLPMGITPFLIFTKDKPLQMLLFGISVGNFTTLALSFLLFNDMESHFSFYTSITLMALTFIYSWIKLKK